MIKFTCINQQHADIAREQLRALGSKTAVVGRTVVSDCDHNRDTARIICESMGYTETVTEWDASLLAEKGGL